MKYHTVVSAFLFWFSLLALTPADAAEIGLDRKVLPETNPPQTVAAIIVSGQIQYGDAGKVKNLLSEINRDKGLLIRRLLIHSPGGYVGEAIAIGKMVRANNVEVFIPEGMSCISACTLILAGGARRTISGKVGIDFPHFLKPAGPKDDVPALLERVRKVMRGYFVSMGVSGELSDAMFTVPKGEVHYLEAEELLKYQLRGL